MSSPFDVLGVAYDADDDAIRQAYLQQLKCNPPERDEKKFRAIQSAYDAIKDRRSRLKQVLFHTDWPDISGRLDVNPQSRPQLDPKVMMDLIATTMSNRGDEKDEHSKQPRR